MAKNISVSQSAAAGMFVCLYTLFLVAAGSGCRPAPVEPAPVVEESANVAATRVYVDATLETACGVSDTLDFYPFDAFVWENPNGDVLKNVAHCLAQGRLKGRKVRLVGHHAPDTPDPSKAKFGKSRAAMVREYLLFHGVEPSSAVVQPAASVRGADTPDGRRVDLELIP